MVWTINGRVYEMEGVADDEMVTLDEPIAWEWINNSPIPHPMHIHNVQFQVVQRSGSPASSYSTVNQGFVDSWLEGHGHRLAWRAGEDCHEVQPARRYVYVSLPHPGA